MVLKKSLFFTLLATLFCIHSPCISTDTVNEKVKTTEETIENLQQQQQDCLNTLKVAFGIGGVAFGIALISRYFLSNQTKNAGSIIKNYEYNFKKAIAFKLLSLKAQEQGNSTGYHNFNDKYEDYFAQAKYPLFDWTPTTKENALLGFSVASGLVSASSIFIGICNCITYYNLSQEIKQLESELVQA